MAHEARPTGTLGEVLHDYARGLQSEMALLRQVSGLSEAQRQATADNDLDGLEHVSTERDRLTTALVTLEAQLKPLRAVIAGNLDGVRQQPAFGMVVDLHREAEGLVSSILYEDRSTLEALATAERTRRMAARAIEAGEATLAAYRRVVAPGPGSASLVDRRG